MGMRICRTAKFIYLLLIASTYVSSAFGQNDEGSNSASASRLGDGSLTAQIAGDGVKLGTYHALLIGINAYKNTDFAPPLRSAVNDVENLRHILIKHYGFESKNVQMLTDAAATRASVLSALTYYRDAQLGNSDNLLNYYAGHGYQHPDTDDGFWIPVDGTADESSWISVTDIRRILKKTESKHTLLVSDSCVSGTLTRATITLPKSDRFLREVSGKSSYQVITSGGLEPVADGGRDGLSLFAYMFTSYLQNQTKHYFSADNLYVDLSPMVANASDSAQTPEHGRIPGTFDEQGQFIFARVNFQGKIPEPEISDFIGEAPATKADMEPGRLRLQDIFLTATEGWDNETNVPDEQMIWKFRSGTINVQVARLRAADYAAGPEKQIAEHPKSFIDSVKEAGKQFRKAKAGLKKTSRIDNLYVSSVDVEVTALYMRQDLIIDYDGGFLYLITSSGASQEKELVSNAAQGVVDSVAPIET